MLEGILHQLGARFEAKVSLIVYLSKATVRSVSWS